MVHWYLEVKKVKYIKELNLIVKEVWNDNIAIMSFCGSRQGSLSVKEGVLKNKCFVDAMNIIPHGLFLVVSILILIAWRESIMGRLKAKTWVHFRCHALRYIFSISLILLSTIEIFEGAASDYVDPDNVNLHVIIPPCFALIGSITSLILYHNIEMWNSPRFLLILLSYWVCSCGLKLLKVFSLYVNNIEPFHLRLWVCWAVILNYTVLIGVELIVLFLQVGTLHVTIVLWNVTCSQ